MIDLIHILAKSGLILRKRASNDSRVLTNSIDAQD